MHCSATVRLFTVEHSVLDCCVLALVLLLCQSGVPTRTRSRAGQTAARNRVVPKNIYSRLRCPGMGTAAEGVTTVGHYLENFIAIGLPNSEVYGVNLQKIETIYEDLGVSLVTDKVEGPTHCLTFLLSRHKGRHSGRHAAVASR